MILELDIEAVTDLSLSTDNHTLGQPETHDFIPGRTLWGAVASEAYRRGMDENLAFRLFHQGTLRFLDAAPVDGDYRSYPKPLAWHQPKDKSTAPYSNFASTEPRPEGQFKGAKGGWCVPVDGGKVSQVKVELDYSLRTAVDPSGKARQGLLYGIPVIRAGTRFWTSISGSAEDLAKVEGLLVGRELRLGRSRNAELGVVRVEKRPRQIRDLAPGSGSTSNFSVLCVSRCVFRDSMGVPTLKPTPNHFGLDESWKLDLERSFIRTTNAVHFNAKRGRPESERFSIERGSVLTFTSSHSVDLNTVVEFTKRGVGEHCGQGYGEVLVAPSWLTQATFQMADALPDKQSKSAKAPEDELFQWASSKAQQRQQAVSLHQEAVGLAAKLRLCGVPASQWGVLRRMAREARFSEAKDLEFRLFDDNSGFVSTGKRRLSKHWKRAEEELKKAFRAKPPEQRPVFLELLASACARPAKEGAGREGEGR